jgi:CubicO group peptidase (beta-lactamase class C family)
MSELHAADLDRIGAAALATQTAPGFSLAIVHDGTVVYAKGFGFADVARNEPVTPQTRFAVGSLTKQFTAAAILLLAQRGRLSLADRLAAHVPSIPSGDAITLRMMLHQTSGLHNYPTSEHPWPLVGPIALSTIVLFLATAA